MFSLPLTKKSYSRKIAQRRRRAQPENLLRIIHNKKKKNGKKIDQMLCVCGKRMSINLSDSVCGFYIFFFLNCQHEVDKFASRRAVVAVTIGNKLSHFKCADDSGLFFFFFL